MLVIFEKFIHNSKKYVKIKVLDGKQKVMTRNETSKKEHYGK
jgi:hypothetical protein